MGNLIFPNTGLLVIAANAVVNLWPPFVWGLYTNNVVLGPGTIFADLTEALTAWGYARQTPTGWATNGIIANIAVQSANTITFSNTSGSPQSVYGYFILDTTGNVLVGVEEFAGAPVTIAPGGTLPVNPVIGDFSQYTA